MVSTTSDHLRRHSRRYAARAGIMTWMARYAWPRVGMTLALLAGALAGMAATIYLRWAGLSAMWLRFPLSVLAAYATFVVCLWLLTARLARRLGTGRLQIRRHSRSHEIRSDSSQDCGLSDFLDSLRDGWDGPNGGGGQGGPGQVDPRSIPALLLILQSVSVVLICIYFVWTAPAILAELATEGGQVDWLYRPATRDSRDNWMTVALELTGVSAFVLVLVFYGTGIGLTLYAPKATTVMEAWQEVTKQHEMNQRLAGQKVKW